MYSINQIKRLQLDDEYYEEENEKYCLVSLQGRFLIESDASNQANFCILQILKAYKENKIEKRYANFLINKVEAIEYSVDMLGVDIVIKKLNKEIIEEELHIPFFNSLCIRCDDIYVGLEP